MNWGGDVRMFSWKVDLSKFFLSSLIGWGLGIHDTKKIAAESDKTTEIDLTDFINNK